MHAEQRLQEKRAQKEKKHHLLSKIVSSRTRQILPLVIRPPRQQETVLLKPITPTSSTLPAFRDVVQAALRPTRLETLISHTRRRVRRIRSALPTTSILCKIRATPNLEATCEKGRRHRATNPANQTTRRATRKSRYAWLQRRSAGVIIEALQADEYGAEALPYLMHAMQSSRVAPTCSLAI
ncbi:uncharacterized protein BKA78DRAFT_176020 [Phyllosticta capitalensis]|uniref:uncharacterized protein n=1 Tax=Phyllosticta capitalensis TaxID=121624 RepID=UPI0031327ED6